MSDFENWFIDQDFYTNMRFIHGDGLFAKDGDVYRVLPVQMAYQSWIEHQGAIDQLKRLLVDANLNFDAANDEIKKLKAERVVLDKRVYLALMIIQANQYCIPDLAIQLGGVLRGENE